MISIPYFWGNDADDGRYEKFFHGANDKFEVQRGLNNVFAYDLVPSVKVCEAALRACRRGTHLIPLIIALELTLIIIDLNANE